MSDVINASSRSNKMCPFAGMTIEGSLVTGVMCIKEKCQLWVDAPGDTLLDGDIFSTIYGTSNPTGTTTNSDGGRCGAQVADYSEHIFKIIHHLHRHHQHPKGHTQCTTAPSGCGDTFFGSSIPTSLKLAMEFESNEDQDGNGKLYGKDFEIIDNEDAPNVLRNLINPTLPKPDARVTWPDFLDNKFIPYYNGVYPNKASLAGGMSIRLRGSFFVNVTLDFIWMDGNTEIILPIDEDDIHVINSNKIYFVMPEYQSDYDIPDGTKISIRITNSGNTFDQEGFAAIIDTGGEAIFENVIELTQDADDSFIKNKMRNEMLRAINEEME